MRLRVPDDARRLVEFDDLFAGPHRQDVAEHVGDFVVRRADGAWAYQLAVAIDDGEMRIDEVIRGDDLLASTARQLLVQRLLALPSPHYGHLPVVRGPDGERLAKRHQSSVRGSTIRELRDDGVTAGALLGELAVALGVVDGPSEATIEQLVDLSRDRPLAPRAWRIPAGWLRERDFA
jgi:glutamyl-tRNA synthetase